MQRCSVRTETFNFSGGVRGTGYNAKIGASTLNNLAGSMYCSDSFRLNGSVFLTAAHCGSTAWYSTQLNANIYTGTTGAAYSLASAIVDGQLLYGSTYSNRVWLGGPLGQSTHPVVGFISESQVYQGGYYLASNGFTGQGTMVMDQKWVQITFNAYPGLSDLRSLIHRDRSPGRNLVWVHSIGGQRISLDALQRRGNPYAALASLTGSGYPNGVFRCLGTSIAAVSYLYGGATVG